MLSLRRIPTFESKVENNLSSSEKDSNLLPLLGESYKFVSTFGIKMSQNWKSHSYVKSMGNYIFRVKTGKQFVQIWSGNLDQVSQINVFTKLTLLLDFLAEMDFFASCPSSTFICLARGFLARHFRVERWNPYRSHDRFRHNATGLRQHMKFTSLKTTHRF